MRRLSTLALVVALGSPAAAEDTPGIRASAERLAAGAVQAGRVEVRRSNARVGIGLAVAVAGAAMMLIDPKQPTQPGPVSEDALTNAALGQFTGLTLRDVIALRRGAGAVVLRCEPRCIGDIDEAILGAFATGAGGGIAATLYSIENSGWRVYRGPIRPFKERSPGLKYGGAALAIAGAALAGFWSTTTVVRDMAVAPTPGGFRVASKITF